MEIDYDKLEEGIRRVVQIIEDKPHIRYIRYLLTKKNSPAAAKKELNKLALSAPHEDALKTYYLAVIDPLVEKHRLKQYYTGYRNKILSKNPKHGFRDEYLNFGMTFEKNEDAKMRFCSFVNELEIDELWSSEISRHYGSTENIPVNEQGNRIIKSFQSRNIERVLTCPKRYLIDKMLIENVPHNRISKHLLDKHKVSITGHDIGYYARVLFNFRRKNLEDMIENIQAESNALKGQLDLLSDDHEVSFGEKTTIKASLEKQIAFYDETLKSMNSDYSEISFKQGVVEEADLVKMFKDVAARGYQRFVNLDQYRDRDVVDPLQKVARMMGYAIEKVVALDANNKNQDKNALEVMFELYRDRYDEVMKEEEGRRVTHTIDGGGLISSGLTNEDIPGMDEC